MFFANRIILHESFFKLFRVSEGEECVFLIMNSVFPAEGSKFITERFDLKGSTVGRYATLSVALFLLVMKKALILFLIYYVKGNAHWRSAKKGEIKLF